MSEEFVSNVEAAEAAVRAIGGKWKIMIVARLGNGPVRFSDLRRSMPMISQQSLTTQLRELERDGIVARAVWPGVPVRVEYALSEVGRKVGPLLAQLIVLGAEVLQHRS